MRACLREIAWASEEVVTMAAVIRFVCRAAAHQRQAATRAPSNPITYHSDSWAYCAFGASDDHKWEAIAAASLEDVRKRVNGGERRHTTERTGAAGGSIEPSGS